MPLLVAGRRHVVFRHIPKTGGTSVEKAFLRHPRVGVAFLSTAQSEAVRVTGPNESSSPQHATPSMFRQLWPDYLSDGEFSVIRHPVARFVSEYKMAVGPQVRQGKQPQDFDEWASQQLDLLARKPDLRDNHLRTMVELITHDTRIFKLENGLETPVKWACRRLRVLPPPIRRTHVGFPGQVSVLSETLERLEHVYREDLMGFDYSMDQIRQMSFLVVDSSK